MKVGWAGNVVKNLLYTLQYHMFYNIEWSVLGTQKYCQNVESQNWKYVDGDALQATKRRNCYCLFFKSRGREAGEAELLDHEKSMSRVTTLQLSATFLFYVYVIK